MRPFHHADPNSEPPRPDCIRVVEHDGAIIASWSWFDLQAIGYLAMGLTILALTTGALLQVGNGGDALESLVGLSVFGLVGVGLVYCGVAKIVNRTTVTASPDEVSVSIGPLPWPGAGRWTTNGTEAVFVAKTAWQVNYRHWYKVMAISRGVRVQVGHALQDAAMARWLVWLVESQAGVPHSAATDEADV